MINDLSQEGADALKTADTPTVQPTPQPLVDQQRNLGPITSRADIMRSFSSTTTSLSFFNSHGKGTTHRRIVDGSTDANLRRPLRDRALIIPEPYTDKGNIGSTQAWRRHNEWMSEIRQNIMDTSTTTYPSARTLRSRQIDQTITSSGLPPAKLRRGNEEWEDNHQEGDSDETSDDSISRDHEAQMIGIMPEREDNNIIPLNEAFFRDYGLYDPCNMSGLPYNVINHDTVEMFHIERGADRSTLRTAVAPSRLVARTNGLFCVRTTEEGMELASADGPRYSTENEAHTSDSRGIWDTGIGTTDPTRRFLDLQGSTYEALDPVGRHDLINAEIRMNSAGEAALFALRDLEAGEEIFIAYGAEYWSRSGHHVNVTFRDLQESYPEISDIFRQFPDRWGYPMNSEDYGIPRLTLHDIDENNFVARAAEIANNTTHGRHTQATATLTTFPDPDDSDVIFVSEQPHIDMGNPTQTVSNVPTSEDSDRHDDESDNEERPDGVPYPKGF